MSSAKVSKRPMTAGRAKKIAKNSLVHIILAILVVIWLFPIFWIIMTSLRGESGAYTAYFFPKELTFNNYKRLFTETTLLNFPRAFMNTLIISIFSCLISTTFVRTVPASRLIYIPSGSTSKHACLPVSRKFLFR